MLFFCLIVTFVFPVKRGTQWRSGGRGARGAKASRRRRSPPFSVSTDCRSSPQRSLRSAAVHKGMLPHSSRVSGAVCVRLQKGPARTQPVDQLPPPPGAHGAHPAVRLVFPPSHQTVRADRSVRGRGAGCGGASSGGSAGGCPLSAVAAAAGGLEGGVVKGTKTHSLLSVQPQDLIVFVESLTSLIIFVPFI